MSILGAYPSPFRTRVAGTSRFHPRFSPRFPSNFWQSASESPLSAFLGSPGFSGIIRPINVAQRSAFCLGPSPLASSSIPILFPLPLRETNEKYNSNSIHRIKGDQRAPYFSYSRKSLYVVWGSAHSDPTIARNFYRGRLFLEAASS